MKRIAMAAAAMIALLGFTGCDVFGTKDTGTTKTPVSTVSAWKIKGSFDGWSEHNLTIDEIDSNKLTYQISGLYRHATLPIVYEFVLVNPDGKEFKATGADKSIKTVTPGTAFTLGDASVTGSTTKANVGFTAAKESYTVTVNIATATAPSVNLVGGATAAPTVTNAILLQKLKIKGGQFSKINGVAVDNWTATAGTVSGSTQSWDVYVDNKTGDFGFDSLDGFLAKVEFDVSTLTATTSAAVTGELLSSGGTGKNATLAKATKDGSTYTIAVTVDMTKAVNAGRYKASVTLKTLSTKNWAYVIPSDIYVTGDITTQGWKEHLADNTKIAVTNKKATYSFTNATAGQKYWKISDGALDGWGGQLTNTRMDFTGSSIAQKDATSDTPNFDLAANTKYIITFDFSSATYGADGKIKTDVALAP